MSRMGVVQAQEKRMQIKIIIRVSMQTEIMLFEEKHRYVSENGSFPMLLQVEGKHNY